jgi:perosamine synthetase
MKRKLTRRDFFVSASAAGAAPTVMKAANGKLALLGGEPVRQKSFPSWPVFGQTEEEWLLKTLRSGNWMRHSGKNVADFEEAYAKLTGAKYCLATANGTGALFASLQALGIGPGDEVILPPYTFIASANVILLQYALPVFVDIDPQSFQIDPRKIEAVITERTRAIMPVHIGGSPVNLDAVLAIARKHKLSVVEDACQAHLAEWRGRKVGTWGDTGCFSFQASKNLNCGEGGAVLTNDKTLNDTCFTFHNHGRPRKTAPDDFGYPLRGTNLKMTEFQAGVLLAQMTRLQEQAKRRDESAKYLDEMFRGIPGIEPARMYEGGTRSAHHLYMFRYRKEHFADVPRSTFLKALRAEGVQGSTGYKPLNKEPFLRNTFQTRGYQAIYPKERLARWEKQNLCPENDKLCEEAVWFSQHMLLGTRPDMEQIVEAVRKVRANAAALKRA